MPAAIFFKGGGGGGGGNHFLILHGGKIFSKGRGDKSAPVASPETFPEAGLSVVWKPASHIAERESGDLYQTGSMSL